MLLVKNASEALLPTGVHKNISLLIENGMITEIGSNIKKNGAEVIDAAGKTVLPGFVDCHTHTVFAGTREFELEMKLQGLSYADISARGGGIQHTVNETRKANIDQLIREAKKRLDAMLAHGTTTVEIKSGYGLNLSDEVKMLKAIKKLNEIHALTIVPTFLGAHAVPPEMNKDDYVNVIIDEIIPAVAEKKLARFCDVFCEKGYFTAEDTRRITRQGKNYGLLPKIHADEFSAYGGAELSAELKATSADHLLMASDSGIQKMAESGVTAVLLPAVPFSLFQDTYADAQKMMHKGVRIALATDLNPNCWTENMQIILQLACFKMRIPVDKAIEAATINAAYALKLEKEVGSIEVGKRGDIAIYDYPSHVFLAYHFGVNSVEMVIKNGCVAWEKDSV